MCIKLSATTLVILHFWTRSGLCSRRLWHNNAQKHNSSASPDSGALYHNSPGNHIIHSPVVLEEEKRDEGWEKEGNWKVLVQSSNGRSVGRDRDQSLLKEVRQDRTKIHKQLNINNSRRQGHISCWHHKYPVRLNQNGRVAGNDSESDKKLPRSGASRPPDAHNLEEGRVATELHGSITTFSFVIDWPHKNTLISGTQARPASFSAALPSTCPRRFPPR